MNRILDSQTRPLVVASQLGPRLNAEIARQVPDIAFIELPHGPLDERAIKAEVVLSMPVHGSAVRTSTSKPANWPGSIRWIQLISAGADGYPQWIFDETLVSCGRGPSAWPIAEFVLATILSAARGFPNAWVKSPGEWKDGKFRARDVAGSTLGLIGFGAIGRRIAEVTLPLGFKIVATRRTESPLDVDGVERVSNIGEVLARSDYAVLALPATDQTNRIIDRNILARAKPGLPLINIARGSLIDDDALLEALDDGTIGLASLDVTDPEPLPNGHPFYTHPRIHLSSHISMSTGNVLADVVEKLAENIRRYRNRLPLNDIVDPQQGY